MPFAGLYPLPVSVLDVVRVGYGAALGALGTGGRSTGRPRLAAGEEGSPTGERTESPAPLLLSLGVGARFELFTDRTWLSYPPPTAFR